MIVKPKLSLRLFKLSDSSGHTISAADVSSAIQTLALNVETFGEESTYRYGSTAWNDASARPEGDGYPIFGADVVLAGYRFDRKKIPALTLKMALNNRIKEHIEVWNQTHADKKIEFISKETKNHIKDSLVHDLLKKQQFTSKLCGIIYDGGNGLLAISGATVNEAEHIYRAIANQIEDANIVPEEITIFDMLPRFLGVNDKDLEDYFDVMTEENRTASDGIGELLTHCWFLSETTNNKDGRMFAYNGGTYDLSLTADKLVVGRITANGKIDDMLCSAEDTHAHIRYKMWSDGTDCLQASFQLTGENFNAVVGLNALKPVVLNVAVKAPKFPKKAEEDVIEDMVLVWVGDVMDALLRFANVAEIYVKARLSKQRWAATHKLIVEWLEGYAPACEVAESKLQEKK